MPDDIETPEAVMDPSLAAEMEAALAAEEAAQDRRKRRDKRVRKSIPVDEKRLKEILAAIDRDEGDRRGWMDDRLARYAKYRGWNSYAKTWPWDNCSDVHLPVMMIDSQRFQDSLVNAANSTRPTIGAKSLHRKDKQREENIDLLHDFQFFIEQAGEEKLGLMAEKFTNDGIMSIVTQWVRRKEKVLTVRIFPPLDELADEEPQLRALIETDIFPKSPSIEPDGKSGYEYNVSFVDDNGKEREGRVEFYFRESGQVEAFVWAPKEVYNGPAVIVKSIEDVIYPWRCGNPQPPSPDNPYGAPHVSVLDYPPLDEIKRLRADGYYDLLTEDDLEEIETKGGDNLASSETSQPKVQKDEGEGIVNSSPEDRKTLTRVRFFDRADVNGDGLEEDVVYWVLREKKKILRARYLTEEYPSDPPRRPIVAKAFIPVGEDRIYGISLLELLECLHDVMVTAFNQAIDNGTLTNSPFFIYRPNALTPDVIRLFPGEGIKAANPGQDFIFPRLPNGSQAFWFNLITLSQQFVEKASMQGSTSFGQVPRGQSSALRNVSSMFALLRQGDARPERILRRFFSGLAEVYGQMHQLNKFYLPKEKEIRITGYKPDDEEAHRTIQGDEIQGEYAFDFKASVFNTSPDALEAALNRLGSILLSPIAVQFGLVTPDKAYNLLADIVKSTKHEPGRYINQPDPESNVPKLLAEEVISAILEGELPEAKPLEDMTLHLQKMLEFVRMPATEQVSFQRLDPKRQGMIKTHILRVRQLIDKEAQRQQLVQASMMAQRAMQPMGGGEMGGGGQLQVGPGSNPQVQGNELLDESLPGAGGGANP